jgi:hypothetical protein
MNVESVNELVDEILDSEGDIVIGGVTFCRSYILRELDPTAYREVALNLIDEHLTDLRDDLESLDPELDADEVETLQGMIAELESY